MLIPMPRRWSHVLFACLLACSIASAQDSQLEDRVKATFIYNFLQYAEWPRQVVASISSFNICILGDSFESVMADTVRGETVNGHVIMVTALSSADEASKCQV